MLICHEFSKYISLNKGEAKDPDGKIITVPLCGIFSSASVKITRERKSDKISEQSILPWIKRVILK